MFFKIYKHHRTLLCISFLRNISALALSEVQANRDCSVLFSWSRITHGHFCRDISLYHWITTQVRGRIRRDVPLSPEGPDPEGGERAHRHARQALAVRGRGNHQVWQAQVGRSLLVLSTGWPWWPWYRVTRQVESIFCCNKLGESLWPAWAVASCSSGPQAEGTP